MRFGKISSKITNNYSVNPENDCFIIDSNVFPGSSGSPVFISESEYNIMGSKIFGDRFIFMGMIKGYYKYNEENIGLGIVIKSNIIHKFICDNIGFNNDIISPEFKLINIS